MEICSPSTGSTSVYQATALLLCANQEQLLYVDYTDLYTPQTDGRRLQPIEDLHPA